MLAERHVDVRPAVERREIRVRHRAGEPDAVGKHPQLGDEGAHLRVVARHAVVAADENETIVVVGVALVDLAEPDVILDLLVGDDAADEEDVDQPVREDLLEPGPPRCAGDPRRVHGDRQHAGRREAERLELAAIELRIAERQVHAADQGLQLRAPERCQPEQPGIVGGKEGGRRDVVVLQDARAAQGREGFRHR